MANIISTLFDFKERGNGLRKIKSDVQAAETATGKFKAGWAGAMDSVKANAGLLATTGGAALVAFGAKAVKSFTDGALAAGEFSAATGASTEEASKWISAAGDIGIAGSDVQKVFQRLNKEIAEGDGVVEEYGLTVQRTADGQVSANETMLAAIDVVNKIQDPTEKARVAQELFGRSYANVAELIFQDADKVRAALESTSEQQVFDEDEVRKAREYREAMDRLADASEDVALVVGERVVPVISDLATVIADVDAKLDDLPDPRQGWFGRVFSEAERSINPIKALEAGIGDLRDLLNGGPRREPSKWVQDVVDRIRVDFPVAFSDAVDEAEVELDRVPRKGGQIAAETARRITEQFRDIDLGGEVGGIVGPLDDLKVEFDELGDAAEDSTDDIITSIDRLRTRLDEENTFARIAEQLNRVRSDPDDRAEVRRLLELVLDLDEAYEDLPDEKITKLFTAIDQGSLDEAYRILDDITQGRSVNFTVNPGVGFFIDPSGQNAPQRVDTAPQIGTVPVRSEPLSTSPTVPVSSTTIINNYPVAPTSGAVNQLSNEHRFGNGERGPL